MGQQVSVETFASTKDEHGNKYWTSFDPYPFKVGRKKLAYMGILNGDGPLAGQKCVVKTIRDGAISRSDWLLESRRAKVARSLANGYNRSVSEDDKKITFNCPIVAEIDTMSDCLCINDILGKPKKKWDDCEAVSIELYLKGKFEDFEFGWVRDSDLWVPEAFSHFSWCQSEGAMLVSNLQGVKSSHAYHLTGPTIHSELKEFGTSDLGHDGIKCFFKYHKCNNICKSWPRLGDGINLSRWGECKSSYSVDRRPSAPVPPPYVNEHPPSYAPHAVSETNSRRYPHMSPWANTNQHVSSFNQMDMRSATHRSTAMSSRQTRLSHSGGVIFDQRQEFIGQHIPHVGRREHDNPAFQDPFGMQLMWLVKEMSYAMYASPPPPYCTCTDRPQSNASVLPRNDMDEDKDYFCIENDRKCLLPPAYSEENVDPRNEYVTYL